VGGALGSSLHRGRARVPGSSDPGDLLDVVLGHRHRVEQDRGDVAATLGVLDGAVGLALLALGQADGELGERTGLLLGGLVDRHALVSGKDVLQTLNRGVLTSHRDLARDTVLVQDRDRRAAEAVVGREDAVDLALVLGEHLLEDLAGLLVVPSGDGLLRDLLVVGVLVQDAVRTLGERGRVGVVR
jgi:hypothetical protein